eukprot:XP_027319333.1 low-density lipoprotein receptor class A domain-containing protein 1 isoform X5 [Anas platyrhynchos]
MAERNGDVAPFHPAKPFSEERGCCRPRGARLCCPPRCVCVTSLLLLAATVAIVGLAVALGLPPRSPANRLCAASNNRTGFLCDDRVTCIPASQVCDRTSNCRDGEDEQEELCGDLPRSLPPYLVFRCGNPAHWVYADKRCNGINDCGDCSDEIGSCKSAFWIHVRLPSVRVSMVELQPRVPRVLRLRAQVAVPRQRPALHQLVR